MLKNNLKVFSVGIFVRWLLGLIEILVSTDEKTAYAKDMHVMLS